VNQPVKGPRARRRAGRPATPAHTLGKVHVELHASSRVNQPVEAPPVLTRHAGIPAGIRVIRV